MKTYTVTLAQLAWIKGSIVIEADSYDEAFAKAKVDSFRADWPVNENGDEVVGFGDIEIDSAYCADEAETDHEGEPPRADTSVYKAAPLMWNAIQAIKQCASGELERPLAERQTWAEAEKLLNEAIRAVE